MAPQEATAILNTLENSRLEFNAAISGLTEQEANSAADANCWSPLQCAEHVILVEERFLGRIEAAEPQETTTANPQREAELSARLVDRTTRARAPEAVHPTGRFTSRTEAIDAFNAVRGRTMKFAEDRRDDLYSVSIEHGRFGRLNGVELLLVIAAHTIRHAKQIRELRDRAAHAI
jgi:hypothetical protein